jgi:large subunit ribosomal protein L9
VKVVFIEDVPDVALAGETKEVADGYGRNYLLPKKLAVIANSGASNIVKAKMKQVLIKRAQAETEMKATAGQIDGVEITIKAKAGEKERLYGSVTGADIAAEIANATGLTVDKRKIEIEEPIRQLGAYDITIKFTHDITAAIKVTVESDETAEEKAAKETKKPRGKKAEETAETTAEVEETATEVETAAAEAEVTETEPAAEEEKAAAEAEATDSTEAKAEEATEEPEAAAPEAEAKEEKPKAKRKSKKKTEEATEE